MDAQGPRSVNAGEDFGFRTEARWWLPKFKDKRHQVLGSVIERVWQQQSYRRELHLRHARLYGNLPILGLGPRVYARKALAGTSSKLAFNVIKSCSDAYTAKVTKERPKCSFVTNDGDHELQEKAHELEKFITGQFYETGVYDKAPSVVLDSAIYGNGILHVYIGEDAEGKKTIEIERIFPWEMLVDDEEAVYGEPRNYYRRKYIDRVILEEMFPEFSLEIAQAKREENGVDEWGYDSTADQVLVTEAWHLKSGARATDGLHTIIISNATLFEEPFNDKDYAPFIVLRKQPALIGWWSTGLAEELEGIQLELNVLLRKIQRSHHLLAAGHWLVRKGSINKQKLDNEIGSIIEYTTEAPQLAVGMTVSPDVYQHLDRLYEKAYEITGISQLQAQGLKPAGLDSGEAQRVYLDIQTERFQVSLRLYHHFYLELARQMLDLAREISEDTPDYAVKAVGKTTMSRVVFRKNFLKENEYVLQLYPTNALATDPESRIAQVQEFANAGWIPARSAMRLLDFPDLKAAQTIEEASYEYTQDLIDDLKHGEYRPPEPFMNLAESIKMVQLAYLVNKRNGLPFDKLELFINWIAQAKDLLQSGIGNAPQPAPGAPPPGGPPPGGGGAPPGGAPPPAAPAPPPA